MGMGSGRDRMARIKQADDGALYVSFRGGKFTVVETWDKRHAKLTKLIGQLEDEAEPSAQMKRLAVSDAKAELAAAQAVAHGARTRLAAAERALSNARKDGRDW